MQIFDVKWTLTGTIQVVAPSAQEAEAKISEEFECVASIIAAQACEYHCGPGMRVPPAGRRERLGESSTGDGRRGKEGIRVTAPTWLWPLTLVTPEGTYRGEDALQEFDRRRPKYRHMDLPVQTGGDAGC